MEKQTLLYEGKAKRVYATQDPELLIVSYKDDATAFNGAKKGAIQGKGVINNQMSNLLMARLERQGGPHSLCPGAGPSGDVGEAGLHCAAGGHCAKFGGGLLLQAIRRGGRDGL